MEQHPTSWTRLLRVSWPFILSNSFWMVQVSLDRLFLGWAGIEGAVGAAMAGVLIFWAPFGLLHATAGYASTFVAQYVGAGRDDRVGAAIWQAVYFSLGAGCLFLLVWPLAPQLIEWVGHDPAIQPLESTYLQTLSVASLPMLLNMSLTSFFAGRARSRTVLLINCVGFTVNALLDYAWVFGRWGFPAMGIAGAGWATVAANTVTALFALSLFLLPSNRRQYGTLKSWRFDPKLFLRLMRFGIPNGVFTFFDVLAFTLFTLIVGKFGRVALDATTIAFTWNLIAFLPGLGIGQAVGVLVGQALGDDRPDDAERSAWMGMALAMGLSALLCSSFLFVPELLVDVFQSRDGPQRSWAETKAVTIILLRFVVVYCCFDNMNILVASALRGAGDTKFVGAVALGLSWPMLVIPTWASWYYGWGLYVAWTFASLYIIALALVFVWRFRQGNWREMRVIETVPDESEPIVTPSGEPSECEPANEPTTNFAP